MTQKKRLTKLVALSISLIMAFSLVPLPALVAADDIPLDEAAEIIEEAQAAVSSSVIDVDPVPGPGYLQNDDALVIWMNSAGTLPPISGTLGSQWQEDALALGNGRIGTMVFGGIAEEHLHVNDKNYWAGPNPNQVYQGGNRTTAITPAQLQTVRQTLDNKSSNVFGYSGALGTGTTAWTQMAGTIGSDFGTQGYQAVGRVRLLFSGVTASGASNYRRSLDMKTAVSEVSFTHGGVDYKREHFVSHPDDVMVTRLTASEAGRLNFDVSMVAWTAGTGKHAVQNTSYTAEGNRITHRSNITNNGMQIESQMLVLNEGGTITANANGSITVAGADAVTIIYNSDTDYKNQGTTVPYFRTGEGRPSAKITAAVDSAAAKGYADLKARHIADHSALFSRVDVDLNGGYVPDIPTTELIARYQRSMVPLQPYVNVIREGGNPTVAVSGQRDATFASSRIIDNNNNTLWFSANTGTTPFATVTLPSSTARRMDMIQLVAVTPEFIVEYNAGTTASPIWTPLPNMQTHIELEHEFQDALLTFDPITTHQIRVRWNSSRIALGARALLNRTLGEIRAFDSSRPAVIPAIATWEEQRYAEVMAYQMGRYLTIAGSREGDVLPTNLCGIWLIGSASGLWNSDFHFNINVQMNYWPTLAANLAESATVFNDYVGSDSLRRAGRLTAERHHGSRHPGRTWQEELDETGAYGFMVHVQNSPFGHTAPGSAQEWGWNPSGSIWALQNVYEYYQFTGDVEYLREKIYPMMKEQAMFWYDYLWYSERQDRWVSSPSHSPEHGPNSAATSYDQQLVWQHFENTIQAAEILGLDLEKVPLWRARQQGLHPLRDDFIGADGQIKEWIEETRIGRAGAPGLAEVDIPNWRAGISPTASIVPHRHPSHLMGLYPGNLITKDSPKHILDAAQVSVDERGFGATSWGKSHKINAWARLNSGKEAFYMMRSMVGGGNGGFMQNLFSSHGNNSGGTTNYTASRIFQIDGNYGYASGFNEVLLQSHTGYVQFLPAIFTESHGWHQGSVKGLVARGNFVVDMNWSDGLADSFKVTPRVGGKFIGEYPCISEFDLVNSAGAPVAFDVISKDRIAFNTVVGETYTLTSTKYTVAFDSAGGTPVVPAEVIVLKGGTVAQPADPSKADYDFVAWLLSGEVYDFDDPVNSDFTLIAGWDATMLFNANGGTGSFGPFEVIVGGNYTIPADASSAFARANHSFAGWNTAANGTGTRYANGDTISPVLPGIILYAQWTRTGVGIGPGPIIIPGW